MLKTPSGKPRARSISIPFDGIPGPNNAITDVSGVLVGYHTLISGEGALVVGKGPVRTGVTAILPRPHDQLPLPCFAGFHSLNGNGEMTGVLWIGESGELQWPIGLTNTHSCGLVRDSIIKWAARHHPEHVADGILPVAAETFDGELNDINGFHVTDEHVFAAIDSAAGGAIELGSVGGGTGMICYDFKGGSGTSSRLVEILGKTYVVGVFVQANFGLRSELVIAGVPVGRHMGGGEIRSEEKGSVIAVVATDTPLLPHQIKRLCRRVSLGLARTGTFGSDGSGDIFLGFTTVNPTEFSDGFAMSISLHNERLDSLFMAVVQATEEAVIDSMISNQDMTGANETTAYAIDHSLLRQILA